MTIEQTTKKSLWIPPCGLAGVLIATAWGCGGAPLPPPTEPEPAVEEVPDGPAEKEVLETGMDCVKAEGLCDMGICKADIQNQCETPVTCDLQVLGLCQQGNDRGEARSAEHTTIPAGDSQELPAQPDCQDATLAGATIEELSCH